MRTVTEPPFETRNDLPSSVRAQGIALLNHRLADAIDLDSQSKQAHWNVKGPQFIALHELFDGLHAAFEGYVDLLAERVVQLGGIAAGTIRMVARRSELDEYPSSIAAGPEHLNALGAALAQFGRHMREAIGHAAGWGDQDTADICTEISRGVDKWLWMVEAHGQGAPSAAAPVGSDGGPAVQASS